jgi:hypothetical protein
MTPDQRRAHLILHGQTLLDAWTARCKLRAEGRKLWAEGAKLWDEGAKLIAKGDELWTEAVRQEFGGIIMKWVGRDCHLGNGEVYVWIT